VPEPATEKAIKKDRERKREGERERLKSSMVFLLFLLFQLKTGIGFTGSFGMRFSDSRNGQWKPRSTTTSNNN